MSAQIKEFHEEEISLSKFLFTYNFNGLYVCSEEIKYLVAVVTHLRSLPLQLQEVELYLS